jgi:branched-chain amino acid transport system substrate-binding protein
VNTVRVKSALVALFSVAVLILAGVAAPTTATVSSRPAASNAIKLGFFAQLSGQYAAAGIDMLNAARLAVDSANEAGGVLGRHITLDPQDSGCKALVAVQAAQKLVADGAVAVVGPYCSTDAIPASTIYHRAGIVMVTPAATNPKLTQQGFDDIFRTIGRDDEQGVFAAGVMVRKLHVTRVAIIHDNTVYAKGLAEQTRLALQKYGGVKVVFFDAVVSGSHDFSPILTRLRSIKPQVTYFTGYYADGGLLLKQFEQLGVPGKFMAGDSNNDPTFIKLAGAYAERALITGAPIPQLVPSAAAFVKHYTASYHRGPGAYSAYTYDATNVVLHAITLAKSVAPAAIVHALHMTKGYPGVTGPITFNRVGDRVQIQYVLITVRSGQFVRAHV